MTMKVEVLDQPLKDDKNSDDIFGETDRCGL